MGAPHPDPETWRKVGVKPGDRLCLLRAPASWDTGAAPEGVTVVRRRTSAPSEVVVAFFTSLRALQRDAAALAEAITTDGMVWVAWPRKAAGHESDLGDEAVRRALLPLGIVDVKVAQLDEDWSGLKFVWRKERRAALRATSRAGRRR